MDQVKVYSEEFPVNEEGYLLVNDLELIEALRRRAKQQNVTQSPRFDKTQVSVKPS